MKNSAVLRSRVCYVVQETAEYLISILVSGTFLARLTDNLGFSDSLTGIISSVVSLGCLFQLVAVLYRRPSVKRYCIGLDLVHQSMFLVLYLVPMLALGAGVKMGLFAVLLVAAYFLLNLSKPKKTSWQMMWVNDGERGFFTAKKEAVSLLTGILFSLGMGRIVDRFTAQDRLEGSFLVCAGVIFALLVIDCLSLVLTVDTPRKSVAAGSLRTAVRGLRDRNTLLLVGLFIFWNIARYCAMPFYGSYQYKELGFSQTLATALVAVGSAARIIASFFWGRYADRHGFAKMMVWCMLSSAFSYGAVVFAVPKTGIVCFTLYNVLNGIAYGGINSCLINVVFDYAPPEKRADVLGITNAAGGIMGFVTTLCFGPVISAVQAGGNRVLGIPMYAQQLVSIIALVLTLLTAAYVKFVVLRRAQRTGKALS